MIGFASLKKRVEARKPAVIGAGDETYTALRKRGLEKRKRRKSRPRKAGKVEHAGVGA